jgi:hypothetical protein
MGGKAPTAVENRSNKLPNEYKLSQNYTNPFNPAAISSFGLPAQSFVSLKIIDLLGREVATIISEILPAGYYSRQWNAAGMSSGIYFCCMQACSYMQAKKLILLRSLTARIFS